MVEKVTTASQLMELFYADAPRRVQFMRYWPDGELRHAQLPDVWLTGKWDMPCTLPSYNSRGNTSLNVECEGCVPPQFFSHHGAVDGKKDYVFLYPLVTTKSGTTVQLPAMNALTANWPGDGWWFRCAVESPVASAYAPCI